MSEKHLKSYECPNCFYLWNEESEDFTLGTATTFCDHCNDNMPMSEVARFDRYFSIIGRAKTASFEVMMPKLWELLKPLIKDDPNAYNIKKIKEKQNENN